MSTRPSSRQRNCFHVWVRALQAGYRKCEKCGAIRKVEKAEKGA